MANLAGLVLAFILEMLKAPPSRAEDGTEGEQRRGTAADRKGFLRPFVFVVFIICIIVAGASELGVGKYLWGNETKEIALLKKDLAQARKDLAKEQRVTEQLRTAASVSEGKQGVLEERVRYLEGIVITKDRTITSLEREITELSEQVEDHYDEIAALQLKVEIAREEKAVLIRKLGRIDEGRKRLWSELSDFGGG